MPNSFPQEQEANRFSYADFGHRMDKQTPMGRWTEGPSFDGEAQFQPMVSEPLGGKPVLAPPRHDSRAQREQIEAGVPRAANDPARGGSPNLA